MFARSLPNVFTIGNLFLGIVSIIFVFNGEPEIAAMLVIVAMLTDGLDGRVARALNVQSDFGKELDSLSDVISFGVAPAFIVYSVAFQDFNSPAAWIATAIFPICGALRLARFNVISGIPGYFIGLPIPAAGGVLATMALFYKELSTPLLLIVELILSFLMISNIKYPNFKKVSIPRSAMWVIPILVIIAILFAIKFPGTLSKLLFIPFVLYALLGLKKNARRVARKRKRNDMGEKPNFRDML
jgi:CDP-diacylglycerol--serine O-phosphatidyltransferase